VERRTGIYESVGFDPLYFCFLKANKMHGLSARRRARYYVSRCGDSEPETSEDDDVVLDFLPVDTGKKVAMSRSRKTAEGGRQSRRSN